MKRKERVSPYFEHHSDPQVDHDKRGASEFFRNTSNATVLSSRSFQWETALCPAAAEQLAECPKYQEMGSPRHLCTSMCYYRAYEASRAWHELWCLVADRGGRPSELLAGWRATLHAPPRAAAAAAGGGHSSGRDGRRSSKEEPLDRAALSNKKDERTAEAKPDETNHFLLKKRQSPNKKLVEWDIVFHPPDPLGQPEAEGYRQKSSVLQALGLGKGERPPKPSISCRGQKRQRLSQIQRVLRPGLRVQSQPLSKNLHLVGVDGAVPSSNPFSTSLKKGDSDQNIFQNATIFCHCRTSSRQAALTQRVVPKPPAYARPVGGAAAASVAAAAAATALLDEEGREEEGGERPSRRPRPHPPCPAANKARGGGEEEAPLRRSDAAGGPPSPPPVFRPPESPFGLLEELCAPDAWAVLVCCLMLNQTNRRQLDPVFHALRARYPTARHLARAARPALERLVAPCGLMRKRSAMLIRFSEEYLAGEWRRPGGGGGGGEAAGVAAVGVRALHGVGKYAADAHAVFCEGRWREVAPQDHALNWYVDWMRGEDELLLEK